MLKIHHQVALEVAVVVHNSVARCKVTIADLEVVTERSSASAVTGQAVAAAVTAETVKVA